MRNLIGLSGYARVGKDEVANILVRDHGFVRVAFADKLREVLYALNPTVKYEGIYDKYNRGYWRVQDVINEFGWDGYKETGFGQEIRYLLQRLGTEAGRQTLWDSIWIDSAFVGLAEDANVVVTDCRFENEAEAIVAHGGIVVRVTRPGVGPANSHASETSLDDWNFDATINNVWDTLEGLDNHVNMFMEWYNEAKATGGF